MRTPRPSRESRPPIWSRHEASTAVQTAAPVDAIAAHLSITIAVEVSAFLIEKVPPKPQHSSAPGSGDELEAAHRLEQPARRVADARHPERVARRVVGDAVREDAPTSVTPSRFDEQLRQLEHPGASSSTPRELAGRAAPR